MEIKIRYTFKNLKTGEIHQSIWSIGELESGRLSRTVFLHGKSDWELIGRDLWLGVQDPNGQDLFNNDILKVRQRTVGKGKNTKYKWFNIAIEFYQGEFILPFKNYGEYRFRDGGPCGSLSGYEKIGDIYTSPELAEK